jgi:hypothetical protein
LNVAGQTRLHEAFWLEQLAKHASELSAIRYFTTLNAFASAPDVAVNKSKNTAVEAILIATSIDCSAYSSQSQRRGPTSFWILGNTICQRAVGYR